MTPLYSTTVTAHGGREGRVDSADGKLTHPLSMPKELGGAGGDGTNPEQLFAAGYAACFESALRLVARTQKIALKDASITAKVTLGKTDEGKFNLAVELLGHLPDLSPEVAKELMLAAHGVCPYSRATHGNIDVKLDVAST
jgi:osmotically inducible protein OsmC